MRLLCRYQEFVVSYLSNYLHVNYNSIITIHYLVFSGPIDSFAWPDVSVSPLYDGSVRENVKDSMLSDHKLNELRSKNLVPGTVASYSLELVYTS